MREGGNCWSLGSSKQENPVPVDLTVVEERVGGLCLFPNEDENHLLEYSGYE